MHSTDAAGALRIVWQVAGGQARTRIDLARVLDLPASTVSLRVQALLAAGVLTEQGEGRSQGGRRPRLLAVNAELGYVWVADVGSRHIRVGVMDISGAIHAAEEHALDIGDDPERIVAELAHALRSLGRRVNCPGRLLGIGVGLPGPVDTPTGTVSRPSRMPGWRGYPVRDALQRHFTEPVVVDNDANLMALGEARDGAPDTTLVVVKAGTGIGAGVVTGGRLHRGRSGAAGDISHVRVPSGGDLPCSCGNHGCLEAVASGAALVRQLRSRGVAVGDTTEVMAAAEDGHPVATTAVRQAGLLLGEVLATVVNFCNPDAVLLGGALSVSEAFVAAVRGALYERCLPLATRMLRIERVRHGADAGLAGAGALVVEQALVATVKGRDPAH